MLAIGIDIGGSAVKAAGVRDGAVEWTGRSGTYARPDRDALARAVAEALAPMRGGRADVVGACVPGLLDEAGRTVAYSANVPGLVGAPLGELFAVAGAMVTPRVVSDANAAGWDLYRSRGLTGRLLALVIGTGVGAAVVDEGGFLRVDGDSPGHLGQCDVSLADEPVIGPDGGAGSLEGYLGAPALVRRYGSVEAALRDMTAGDPPVRALARVIRIAHAIYRPHHVCLAGGFGIRIGRLLPGIRSLVGEHLTRIARPDWTLSVGDSDFHAAIGAARLAVT